MKPLWYFFIFSIFLLLFWNFQLCFGLERNGTVNFIFSLSRHFPIYFGLKWCQNGIVEFFCYFFGIFYYSSGRNGTERNDNFYFPSFPAFSNLFCLEKNPQWCFLTFWIFLLFFWNFLLRVVQERNETLIFIFSPSRPFPTYFGLEWSHNGIF